MILSRSIVRVNNNIEVPKKAKVKRKLQKNRVPQIDIENMEMESAWWEFKPMPFVKKNRPDDTPMRIMIFRSNLSSPFSDISEQI